jgi:hypothetical protein
MAFIAAMAAVDSRFRATRVSLRPSPPEATLIQATSISHEPNLPENSGPKILRRRSARTWIQCLDIHKARCASRPYIHHPFPSKGQQRFSAIFPKLQVEADSKRKEAPWPCPSELCCSRHRTAENRGDPRWPLLQILGPPPSRLSIL